MKHGTKQQKQDAMSVWMENVNSSQFEVCLRESRALDGGHSKISVVSPIVIMSFSFDLFHITIKYAFRVSCNV